ncbi:hypothetical protein [Heliorestis acidaminivorans]|nr:hypothetical protein [Heliorestis acidaminivorans]
MLPKPPAPKPKPKPKRKHKVISVTLRPGDRLVVCCKCEKKPTILPI